MCSHRTLKSILLLVMAISLFLLATTIMTDHQALINKAEALSQVAHAMRALDYQLKKSDISYGGKQRKSHEVWADNSPVDLEAEELAFLNVTNMSEKELASFFKAKEHIYAERRQMVQSYCSSQPETFSRRVFTLLHDPEDGVSMCPVAKIASSTWKKHFSNIGNTKHNRTSQIYK